MPKIIAKFSNGFEDKYNGKRDVKAAWMITRKSDGKVMHSGHSLDAAKAAKTAAGNLQYLGRNVDVDMPKFDVPRYIYAGVSYKWLFDYARARGYEGRPFLNDYKRWAKAKNAERRAATEAAVNIEVIDL